ncbi:MAG: PilZ domain-containing protein [Myxococcota bacterium]|nr:PilZ domain-containing protein [Myxococcota bacterium]
MSEIDHDDSDRPDFAEFAELNRRRVFGNPALTIEEVERWQQLRELLSREFGDTDEVSSDPNRRMHVRHATHLRVVLDSAAEGIAMDISLGGMFIATPRPLPLGSELSIEMALPQRDDPLFVKASVVRSEEGGALSGRTGMGIMFADIAAEQASVLKDFLGQLEQR